MQQAEARPTHHQVEVAVGASRDQSQVAGVRGEAAVELHHHYAEANRQASAGPHVRCDGASAAAP